MAEVDNRNLDKVDTSIPSENPNSDAVSTENQEGVQTVDLDENGNCPEKFFKATYFANQHFKEHKKAGQNCVSEINFDWGESAPQTLLTYAEENNVKPERYKEGITNKFSVRYEGEVNFEEADYQIHLQSDDFAKLYIDGEKITDSKTWKDGYKLLENFSGKKNVRVDFRENKGDASVKLDFNKIPSKDECSANGQYLAKYFEKQHPKGEPKIIRVN